MTDASIILSGNKPINHSKSIAEAMGLVQTAIDAPNQSKMLGEQVRSAGLQNDYQAMVNQRAPTMLDQQTEQNRIANESGNLTLEAQQNLQYLRNAAPDAYQMSQLIDAGQTDRARALLAKRIKMLQDQGRDSSDSEAIMQQLEAGNIDGVRSELQSVVDTSVRAGVFGQGASGTPAAVLEFQAKAAAAGLKPGTPEYERAALVDLGVAPSAGSLSSQERIAASPATTEAVARSEGRIAGVKAGSAESATLGVQLRQKPAVESAVTTAQADAKAASERAAALDKKIRSAGDANSVLDIAEPLLSQSTGSYAGAFIDAAGQVVGLSNEGAQAAAQLKALEGALILNMPRMEGPQSDRDAAIYRQMAAQIGDSTVPIETRKAAVQALRTLNARYSNGGGQTPQQKAPQAQQNGNSFTTSSGIKFTVE
jgi:hypothetical protein